MVSQRDGNRREPSTDEQSVGTSSRYRWFLKIDVDCWSAEGFMNAMYNRLCDFLESTTSPTLQLGQVDWSFATLRMRTWALIRSSSLDLKARKGPVLSWSQRVGSMQEWCTLQIDLRFPAQFQNLQKKKVEQTQRKALVQELEEKQLKRMRPSQGSLTAAPRGSFQSYATSDDDVFFDAVSECSFCRCEWHRF